WSSGREAAYTERLPVTVTGELRRPYLRAAVAFGALLVLASAVFALSRRPSGAEPLKPAQITASDGLDLFPALSHDGKTVVYASDKTGRFEIYRRALEISSREIQLTDDGQQNVSPALSPSGEFVAYHSKIAGGIWIVPSLGGVPRQLTPFGARPVWSPDGKLIAFQSAAILDLAANSPGALPPSTLWIVDAAGGEPRAVTKPVAPPGGHGAPCFSPDGRRLAFSSYNRVSADVYLVNLDGSDLIALTSGSGFRYDPVFVEEGEAVVYSYFDSSWNSSIQKLRITKSGKARGPAETLSNLGFGAMKHLAYAPGASLLAYSAQSIQSNIWSVPVDGATFGAAGPAKPLTRENGRNTRPVFSGDGSRIALTKWRLGATQDIWFIDPDGKNPTQRTNNPEDDDYAQWMPDGKRLAFASRRVDRRLTMWVQDLASGKEELLADPGPEVDGLRLSQDGKLLAFNSTRGGSAINTWLLPIGAREPRALTNDPEMMGFPVFTPDGEAVVLEHKRGNDAQLVLVPVAGGEPRTLTQGPGQSWPWSISSDGLRVFYAGLREGVWNIYSIPLEGGAEVPLTKLEKLNAYVRYPAVSPDGKTVVYEQAETTGNIWILEGVK
ncbi:MAG: PD40 domain-containing protein, partial [Acidobacteria bacterium]|nr:PD40 domain-containing protein [Acidobacteriota bacterium]